MGIRSLSGSLTYQSQSSVVLWAGVVPSLGTDEDVSKVCMLTFSREAVVVLVLEGGR